jgi:hypothetical protein
MNLSGVSWKTRMMQSPPFTHAALRAEIAHTMLPPRRCARLYHTLINRIQKPQIAPE